MHITLRIHSIDPDSVQDQTFIFDNQSIESNATYEVKYWIDDGILYDYIKGSRLMEHIKYKMGCPTSIKAPGNFITQAQTGDWGPMRRGFAKLDDIKCIEFDKK